MSEALQLSLLARPPSAPGVDIAVRYRPAAEQAQVGGDWYDAFALPDGTLMVVVGDVTGHDLDSAVAMAQVRNLLRGVCVTLQAPPSAVLAGLDHAMDGLGVDVFATAILMQVAEPGGDGRRELRWCNAGHLPPVVVAPDGRARLLEAPPDVLLGVAAAQRADRVATLEPGSAVVIYTDGLIERRGVPLTESIRWLAGVLDGQAGRSAEWLADHVIGRLEGVVEDDVAVLVMRV
jgi:serine phosphatase RsbU (regulator of sigma subunit)